MVRQGKEPPMPRRWLALWCWAYLGWIILTWTRTAEQLVVGALVAALVAWLCAPLGDVAAPWRLLEPRRLVAVGRLTVHVAVNLVRAHVSLSRRIWAPSRPLRPGMVVVATEMRSEGGLTAVGVLTSLIVENQIVDLDRSRKQLQYHTVWADTADPAVNRKATNGPVEDRLRPLE
jgi:multicomponent Na+:H+ antiporter subunit E